MKHRLLLFLLSAIQIFAAYAQTFKAQIESRGGYYSLIFTVSSSSAEGFTPPSLAAFEVLSGPNTSVSNSIEVVNGSVSRKSSTTYTYIVSPRKSGRITIGPATVKVNGRTLRSNSVAFNAQASTAGNGRGQGGGNGSAHSSQSHADENVQPQQAGSPVTMRDLYIDVVSSRTKVREQEAVLLTYRIHARTGVVLQGTSLAQKPDFKGLISQEIPLPGNQIETVLEHKNGTTYRTGTILQYVIFPQHSGKLTIPSITFGTTVIQQERDIDPVDAFFNGGGTIGVNVKRTVAPLTLNIEPLPQPRPSGFSGAVGKFTIKGELLNKTLRTNDAATYRITIEGTGNLKLITAPSIVFPKDFDTFDAKSNEQSSITAEGQKGKVTFDYTFIPQNVGQYTLPAVSFIYFDTESGSYKTLNTQSLKLNVEKGNSSKSQSDRTLQLMRSDIAPLHTEKAASLLAWGTAAYWLSFLGIALVGILSLSWVSRYARNRSDIGRERVRTAARRALKALDKCAKQMSTTESADFYASISRTLIGYLSDTFGVGQSELTSDTIASLLAEAKVDTEVTNRLIALLESCRYAAYAPGASENKASVSQEAADIIRILDKGIHH